MWLDDLNLRSENGGFKWCVSQHVDDMECFASLQFDYMRMQAVEGEGVHMMTTGSPQITEFRGLENAGQH